MRNFPKPPQNRKRRPRDTRADFALKFKMITPDEHKWIVEGNMNLYDGNQRLMNLNVDHRFCGFSPGLSVKLYQGRADQILIDRMLGLDHQDEDT